jgi:predicted Zn-dependent protease with MMP-like domain
MITPAAPATTRPAALGRVEVCRLYVRMLLEQWPRELRAGVEGVRLEIKDLPGEDDFDRGCSPDLRGYFFGESLDPDGDGTGCLDNLATDIEGQPLVVLFAGNIEPLTAEHVARVLLHEFGHYLGYSEDELVEGLGLI